ncbi:sirohydrochlorin chelatase [Ectobacillus ponti]|uniref:Sirohydrochlorin chelatase n=1 Tax=Ectobacillus ponti TaxID=2961894 RepID=A0AA41XAW6_9BACI|nr:sirohydrochlorin chelatase [Ectobacillus ponti]MCP8968671.1 sirohydrochlorin chelatase [Ectobacillus ponti]
MQAVLYICHGSRVKEAGEQARFFAERCMEKVDAPIQEVCFLELTEPSIEEGFRRCVERGATTVAAVPVLLLTAAHAKEDIPQELEKVRLEHPHIPLTYGRPLGVHQDIVSILLERIGPERIGEDAMALLVGRGSSDPDVKRDFRQIADLLQETHPFQRVDVSYLAAAEPTFEQGLAAARETSHQQIFVVPYLLFTGLLMKGMERTIRKLADERIILCEYLGYHDKLERVMVERVREAIDSEPVTSFIK